jgi:UDP-N-acetylglucosamine 2-epimerase (non-hydrolysing)
MLKIINVVGARPNFMKIAPIIDAIKRHNRGTKKNQRIKSILVHTGQHYDEKMSELFFIELGIPRPDLDLGVGSGTHAEQTAETMKRFEPILLKEKPDYILVVGDVNSTIACALTASKLGVKIIHVEAGLRSFDRDMPEEINRVLTDAISDLLFTSEKSALDHLVREGISKEKIFFVGNVMIDTLLKQEQKARKSDILSKLGLFDSGTPKQKKKPAPYAVLTLHRPSNVDNKRTLQNIIEAVSVISREAPVIFPIHPRTRKRIDDFGFQKYFNFDTDNLMEKKGVFLTEPMGYLDFLHLMSNAKLVLTDSGGMQEETTVLGIPCVTLRENTERPVTVSKGTNKIVGTDKTRIIREGLYAMSNNSKKCRIPELWDGKAAERIIEIILEDYDSGIGK